ncbi:type 1 glutamine amidotransferase domain-containing protein [Pseudomonas juntendi]|uniref:Type 1 glutamine amidotransferase domain-containing protein n=1 Tax=Pseudomonas juntendi TaxID=2666183 RepID=A0AAJ5S3W6_9PSED|nr:type 1 glutamine amidotransferase domain-containing protein [Pseudomonas juntendi]MDM3891137.1 type 1 glutamine amidotransferase domain-containing protein [Pseudomonas juntendi]QOH70180.1 type 1 glutamine amidotransferase domain-containing protein [Pseudomonas putida]WEA22404.1 type 1 glutamine amidotransferase domain-containing protein [Pseudomonas juntendi]
MKSLCKSLLLGLAFAISATSHAAPKGEVLVLLSSETEMPLQDGKTLPTGYYLNEFGGPADALLRAGYQLTVATPKGNQPKADPRSIDPVYFAGKAGEMRRIQGGVESLTAPDHVRSLAEVMKSGLGRYDGVFIPGRHAGLIDLSNNPKVGQLLQHFHAQGKPTAPICRGPIALLAAQDDPGSYEQALVNSRLDQARNWAYSGYRMTIFSDAEEKVFEDSLKGEKLRYYPAKAMAQAGGQMQFADAWQPKVVVDRELITGQNPFSDHALATEFIKSLNQHCPLINS